MDIHQLIDEQNKIFVFGLNRKLGNILPEKLVIKLLTEKKDPHQIALLMIKTSKEINKPSTLPTSNEKSQVKTQTTFQKFVCWIKGQITH